MSLARLNITQKSRKPWKCGKCGVEIPVGHKVIHFTVGYRGFEQHRCGKPECYPKPSERESSAVATVYAAQENIDINSATSKEDLDTMVMEVADACQEVADEYQSNEMYEINYDLQERADQLETAAADLESWADTLDEEPSEEYEDSWSDHDNYDDAWADWFEDAKEKADDAINNLDIP